VAQAFSPLRFSVSVQRQAQPPASPFSILPHVEFSTVRRIVRPLPVASIAPDRRRIANRRQDAILHHTGPKAALA